MVDKSPRFASKQTDSGLTICNKDTFGDPLPENSNNECYCQPKVRQEAITIENTLNVNLLTEEPQSYN